MKLQHGVETTQYTTSRFHKLLAEFADSPEGPNIGRNGERLTITFLSCDRIELSLRLLNSISKFLPDFRGEVLVVDNGSTDSTLHQLKLALHNSNFRSRLIELKKNFGVAGGRNRTLKEIKTPWALSVDNDCYFVQNILALLQEDLAKLGCKFCTLPLLNPDLSTYNAAGAHLHMWLDENSLLAVGGSSSMVQETGEPLSPLEAHLGTFFSGTAFVFNVESFRSLGEFDENMFVGFEDTDFSIRIFRAGLKIGISSAAGIVHDHPPASTNSDVDYEKIRHSREIIEKAAKYLENKYALSFWNQTLWNWLDTKSAVQNVVKLETENPGGKPRIALITDRDDWAFQNIATQLTKSLKQYSFEIFPFPYFSEGAQLALLLKGFDLVHFFWRDDLYWFLRQAFNGRVFAGTKVSKIVADLFSRSAITTAVYDHLFLEPEKIVEKKFMFDQVDGYYVCSKRLQRIYTNIDNHPKPSSCVPDGVDLNKFQPKNLRRLDELDRPLVIGWAGNSRWAENLRVDSKGLNTILLPAIERLRSKGVKLVTHFADRSVARISYEKMSDYYAEIDIYVCCSDIEGTPNPVLESMACGVPVISTDVGIVPEAFGPLQKNYIIKERTVDSLVDAIEHISSNREYLTKLSNENLQSIRSWRWEERTKEFAAFFERAIDSRKSKINF